MSKTQVAWLRGLGLCGPPVRTFSSQGGASRSWCLDRPGNPAPAPAGSWGRSEAGCPPLCSGRGWAEKEAERERNGRKPGGAFGPAVGLKARKITAVKPRGRRRGVRSVWTRGQFQTRLFEPERTTGPGNQVSEARGGSSVVSFTRWESRGRREMRCPGERTGAGALPDPALRGGWAHLGSPAFRVCEPCVHRPRGHGWLKAGAFHSSDVPRPCSPA